MYQVYQSQLQTRLPRSLSHFRIYFRHWKNKDLQLNQRSLKSLFMKFERSHNSSNRIWRGWEGFLITMEHGEQRCQCQWTTCSKNIPTEMSPKCFNCGKVGHLKQNYRSLPTDDRYRQEGNGDGNSSVLFGENRRKKVVLQM